jgi:hypothetical protein
MSKKNRAPPTWWGRYPTALLYNSYDKEALDVIVHSADFYCDVVSIPDVRHPCKPK